jgi:hypothetical protein
MGIKEVSIRGGIKGLEEERGGVDDKGGVGG